MTKSIAVLGLGNYGKSLVRALSELGAEVLGADLNEANVNEVADCCTAAVCTDLSNEDNLLALGLKDMDIVVVAMGKNLEASILSVAISKELGVPRIVAKSPSERISSILRKVGANEIIVPEEYAGRRSAIILYSDAVLDYFEVDASLCMVEMLPLREWTGKTLNELNMRNEAHINVVARRNQYNKWIMVDPERPLEEGNKLLVVLERKTLNKLSEEPLE